MYNNINSLLQKDVNESCAKNVVYIALMSQSTNI